MTRSPIHDEYSELPISRQQRYALRHPDKLKSIQQKYEESDKRKAARQAYKQANADKIRAYNRDYKRKLRQQKASDDPGGQHSARTGTA